MNPRTWPLATFAFGLATLAILIGFGLLPEVRAGYPAGDFAAALSAFQRAETMAELNTLFGDPPDPLKLAAMSAGNTLDLYAFIAAYTLFLVAAAGMLAGGVRAPPAWLAIAPALLGAGADVFETHTQLLMTADWPLASALLHNVAPACWAKYFALAAASLGLTAICLLGPRKRWILGMLGFVPLAGVFAAWAGVFQAPALMSAVFGAHWIALLAVAGGAAFGRK